MKSLNRIMLIGNLGRDPEVRYAGGGTAVCNFTLATNESWKDRDGNSQERTEWHKIVAWGKLGEICGEFLAKGKAVYIEGRTQTREWEDRDGQKRKTTEVVAHQMIMLAGDSRENGGEPGVTADDARAVFEDQPETDPADDVPF